MKHWHVGFVVPRYGAEILGGAETLARGLAEHLVVTDWADVQVLTTTARDYFSWQNDLPAGDLVVNGVPVRRFRVDEGYRDVGRCNALHTRLFRGEHLSTDEQYEWIHHSAHHSAALYQYLEASAQTFDFLVLGPYLYGLTHYSSAICPDRSVLWPCLHDEVYAYIDPARDMFRTCAGVMLNTRPELQLAERLWGHHRRAQVVGLGFTPFQADGNRFRERYGVQDPFVLYAGRLEQAKNVPILIRYFQEYKQRCPNGVKLVLIGWGPEELVSHPDILQLGFIQEQDKLDAFAAATVLCQPSINESFSIVLMESWLCGVPVLVNGNCPVTRNHVTQSQGGLYFRDADEFEFALELLTTDESLRNRLGNNGRSYVVTEFSWDAVLARFALALEKWSTRTPQ